VGDAGINGRRLGSGRGTNNTGKERPMKAVVTAKNTSIGTGRIRGCRSKTAPHREQIGVAPLGGCNTIAGPQQQSGQRKRGISQGVCTDRKGQFNLAMQSRQTSRVLPGCVGKESIQPAVLLAQCESWVHQVL
jgi:hypothetical protein